MRVMNIAKKLNVPAAGSGDVVLYRVDPAITFTLNRVIFHFPTGTNGQVGLSIRQGLRDVCPDDGLLYGDNATIELHDDTTFTSGDQVILHYKNEDTANAYDVIVVIEGVVE